MRPRPQSTRRSGLRPPRRVTLALILANVIAYVVYLVLMRAGFTGLTDALAYTPRDTLTRGWLWQPLTAMFLHSPYDIGHLLMNSLFLWLFGNELEDLRGRSGMLQAWFVSGLGGWLVVMLAALGGLALGSPSLWGAPHLGASGAVIGVTACWAGVLWRQVRHFWLLGPMEVRTFLLIMVGIQLLGALSYGAGTSWWGHLGGLGFGLLLGRGLLDPRGWVLRWRRRRIAAELAQIERKKAKFNVILGGRGSPQDKYDN